MPNLPEFRPGLCVDSVHEALKQSVAVLDQAQHCAVLWFGEIMGRGLFRELGYSTMRAYALEELGFSSTRTGDFMRLVGKLEKLPVLKKELSAGRLGYSKALEIIPVAGAGNEDGWVALAKTSPRAEVRAQVQRAVSQRKENPAQPELMPRPAPVVPAAAMPVSVGFELSPGQHARYEAMMKKIGHRGNKAELLLAMAEALLAESAPKVARRRAIPVPHYQVHVHQCPECAKTTVATPQGERELNSTEAAAVCCDVEIHVPGERKKTAIPPKIRREVLTRDRHQCRRKGCRHTRFLHLHHLVPRAVGGSHDPENLVTLCSACHDLWHARGGDLRVILREVLVGNELASAGG